MRVTFSSSLPIQEGFLESRHLVDGDIPHESVCATIEDGHLFPDRHRAVLGLNQQDIVLAALVQRHGRHLVHIGRELGKGLQLIVLGLIDFQRTGHLPEIPTLIAGRIPRLKRALSK